MSTTADRTLEERYEQALTRSRALQMRNVELQEQSRALLGRSQSLVNGGLMLMLAAVAERRRRTSYAVLQRQADRLSVQAQALAHIHDALDGSEQPLTSDALLGSICRKYSTLRGARQISLETTGEPLPIGFGSAMPLSLMTIELVANAYDHAFKPGQKGEILVGLRRGAEGRARLTVSDNGRGLRRFEKGAGFFVVESLAHTLDGDVAYHSHGGAQVSIIFPDAASLAA